jgi:hypothetical protein
MKGTIFSAVFLMFFVIAGQLTAQDAVKFEVVKFNWSMYDPQRMADDREFFDNREMINPNDPATRPDSLASRTNARTLNPKGKTIEEQSRDLARVEANAAKDAMPEKGNIFLYELQVKNLHEKAVKSFVWEYLSVKDANSPQSASNRRFLCREKIKPGAGKTLRILSHLPPAGVLDASSAGESGGGKGKKNFAVDIMIDRVEFEDGTIWKRPGWDDSRFNPDAPLLVQKLKINNCAAL